MTTKTTEKWDAKRKQIIHIAEDIFSERGFKGTRLQDIADILDMQRPSLLYYFKNKKSLLDAVIKSVVDRFHEVVTTHIGPGTGIGSIYTATDAVCAFLIANPSCSKIIVRQATDPEFPQSGSSFGPINRIATIIRECAAEEADEASGDQYVYYFLSQVFLTIFWVSINNATKRSMSLDLLSPEPLAFLHGAFQRLRLDPPSTSSTPTF